MLKIYSISIFKTFAINIKANLSIIIHRIWLCILIGFINYPTIHMSWGAATDHFRDCNDTTKSFVGSISFQYIPKWSVRLFYVGYFCSRVDQPYLIGGNQMMNKLSVRTSVFLHTLANSAIYCFSINAIRCFHVRMHDKRLIPLNFWILSNSLWWGLYAILVLDRS